MFRFIIECRSCGVHIECTEGMQTALCKYCGIMNTVGTRVTIRRENMYNSANNFRRMGEYDKAIKVYKKMLSSCHDDAESYWGIVLCRFGIEYVEDPVSKERILTCHKPHYWSIFMDEYYKETLKYASNEARWVYESEAQRIDSVRKVILARAEKEERFDIIICYKENDNIGKDLGQEIYNNLGGKGYRVFFTEKTLEGKTGVACKQVILAALNSAMVMLVIGTRRSTSHGRVKKSYRHRERLGFWSEQHVRIVNAYKRMSPYDTLKESATPEAIVLSRIEFLQDLTDIIDKVLIKDYSQMILLSTEVDSPFNEPLYTRGLIALKEKNYAVAAQIFFILGNYKEARDKLELSLPESVTFTIPGSQVQLKMRMIPAGSYLMGSPSDEQDSRWNEYPQHQVTINKPFYMGTYVVTQAQWQAVMGTQLSYFDNNAEYPVEDRSWDDCQKFIQKLNTMGIGTFRLPTEAEWEYACRAGSATRFPWGDDPNYNLIDQYAWHYNNSKDETYPGGLHPVGQKLPNTWGLYDMHGNIWEWCSDWYGSYLSGNQVDPKGPATILKNDNNHRVLRGGSWYSSAHDCRSAFRSSNTPTSMYYGVGFRLVRIV